MQGLRNIISATYSQMVQKKKKKEKVRRQGKEIEGERENKFGKKC